MDSVKEWHIDKTLQRTMTALKARQFDAYSFRKPEDLAQEILKQVVPGATVGMGGSVGLRELGLPKALEKKGVLVLDTWRDGLTPEEVLDLRLRHLSCDIFLSGINALTEKGEIVNMDGIGNRIGAMTFGPRKVILVAGINKIVPDLPAAFERIKRVAAPMNARRMGLPLPCAETGQCHDCQSDLRICRALSIIERRPNTTDVAVYLVAEELGY
jgi:L-lactate utilization protein LutB